MAWLHDGHLGCINPSTRCMAIPQDQILRSITLDFLNDAIVSVLDVEDISNMLWKGSRPDSIACIASWYGRCTDSRAHNIYSVHDTRRGRVDRAAKQGAPCTASTASAL
jgi:hypothetical protein